MNTMNEQNLNVLVYCRELNPDNVLLGDQGHATLTYFFQINQVNKSVDFEAINNLYVAPGMYQSDNHR